MKEPSIHVHVGERPDVLEGCAHASETLGTDYILSELRLHITSSCRQPNEYDT